MEALIQGRGKPCQWLCSASRTAQRTLPQPGADRQCEAHWPLVRGDGILALFNGPLHNPTPRKTGREVERDTGKEREKVKDRKRGGEGER